MAALAMTLDHPFNPSTFAFKRTYYIEFFNVMAVLQLGYHLITISVSSLSIDDIRLGLPFSALLDR